MGNSSDEVNDLCGQFSVLSSSKDERSCLSLSSSIICGVIPTDVARIGAIFVNCEILFYKVKNLALFRFKWTDKWIGASTKFEVS